MANSFPSFLGKRDGVTMIALLRSQEETPSKHSLLFISQVGPASPTPQGPF